MTTLTASGIGAVLFVVGFVMWKRGVAPKAVSILWMLAAFAITGGLWDAVFSKGGAAIGAVASTVTAKIVGTAVPLVVFAAAATWWWLDMRKKGNTSKAAPWLGLALPVLLATTAGVYLGLGGVIGKVGNGVGEFTQTLVTGWSES